MAEKATTSTISTTTSSQATFVGGLIGDARLRQVIDGWLDQQLELDAIFASADIAAISLIGALRERGLDVPGRVRVAGYDDIMLSAYLHPSLTTVRQPIDAAGEQLVVGRSVTAELDHHALRFSRAQDRKSVV